MTVTEMPSFKDGASVRYLQCAGPPGARLLTGTIHCVLATFQKGGGSHLNTQMVQVPLYLPSTPSSPSPSEEGPCLDVIQADTC